MELEIQNLIKLFDEIIKSSKQVINGNKFSGIFQSLLVKAFHKLQKSTETIYRFAFKHFKNKLLSLSSIKIFN